MTNVIKLNQTNKNFTHKKVGNRIYVSGKVPAKVLDGILAKGFIVVFQ